MREALSILFMVIGAILIFGVCIYMAFKVNILFGAGLLGFIFIVAGVTLHE